MKVPFVSFKPMEKELDKDLREAVGILKVLRMKALKKLLPIIAIENIVWEQEMVLMH